MTKVLSARALLGESPEKASDRVCRLRLVQGNLVLLVIARKSVLKKHHIDHLTKLYYKKKYKSLFKPRTG